MFRLFSILVVAACMLAGSDAFAWGWKEAVNQAVDKNPTLQSKKQGVQEFQFRNEVARSVRYPALNLTGQYLEFQDQTRSFRHRAYIGPELQYLLYQGGKVSAGIGMTDAQVREADANVSIESVNTQSKLRSAFASAVYAKNYLELTRKIQQRRKDNMNLTKIRYESGLEYRWVYLTNDAKLKQADLDVADAEMNKVTALSDLEILLGEMPVKTVEDISDADFYPHDAIYDLDQAVKNVENNPNYLAQKARMEGAEARVDYNKADFYPAIGLQGNLWVMSVDNNNFFPAWYVGGGLRMPLFQGGRVRKNTAVAKAQLSETKFDLEQVRLNVKTGLQKNFRTYQIARQQVEVGKAKVEAAKTRATVVAQQYRSGLATFLDWDTSQDVWVSAEIDLLNNIRNYQTARAKLEESMGFELSEL